MNGEKPSDNLSSFIPHPSSLIPKKDDPRIKQLLEELLDTGATPEEVCRACPELLPRVRARWQRLRALEAEIGALFPNSTATGGAAGATPPPTELPQVPGYEVEAVLGHGGMGVVYKARQLRLNRAVALKMLLAGPHAQPQELERFLREAEAVAGLRHPNIVQVHDVGDLGGRPYFTMEYVEGGSLAQKIAGVPQPVRAAAALVALLADAVHTAHQSGIIHRDLKPANILLQKSEIQNPKSENQDTNPVSDFGFRISDSTPKVTDFGLARRLEGGSGLTLSGVPLGTPSYMAPEQARGDKAAIGPATDVYALGAILYECLTGRPPFRAETATATLQQVLADDPVRPARLNRQVPRDLETICLKCLAKDPHRRYPTAEALADDLRRFDRGEPIAARPAGWLERAAKWVRRRPAAAVLLAAGVLMLAVVTAAAVWYVDHRARLRSEEEVRGTHVNREANEALDQAERQLKDLRAQLDDPAPAWELLSEIDRWQATVGQARQDVERAKSATRGNEALVGEETRARIQTVEAAVGREEAACELARDLDKIAVEAVSSYDTSGLQQRKAVAEYERLFSRQGLDIHQPGTDWFVSAIRSSPARFALIAALDNWAWLASSIKLRDREELLQRDGVFDSKAVVAGFIIEDPQVARLLELARAADPDPWGDRFRDPAVWADGAALARLGNEVDVGRQSPTVLAMLGWWLGMHGEDPTALFQRALLSHPRNFWLDLIALSASEPGLGLGLAHALCAIRPRSAVAYMNLGSSLRQRGNLPEAVVAFNRAIKINPNYAIAHHYRALALRDLKDLPGAGTALQRAIELDPGCLPFRHDLGQVLQQQGRYAEAEQAYLGAVKAQPASAPAYDALARFLATCPDDKARDGKRAVEYATTACERTGWKTPLYLDTLAAAYAETGQFEEAVRYQTRALEDQTLKGDLRTAARKRLELYRQKKPFRDQGP
jgi:serine/threonine-protein kinase